MNILSFRLVLDRSFLLRFIAVLTFWLGGMAVWVWRVDTDEVLTHFLVQLSPEPSGVLQETEPVFGEEDDFTIQITNMDFRRFVLSRVNLSSAKIINSDFGGAPVDYADFSGSKIQYSNFTGSNLHHSNFARSMVYGSDFTHANLGKVRFFRANLGHSDFTNAVLSGADLTDANLSNARLETAIGLKYEQLRSAVINEFTTLPPDLEFKRGQLMKESRRRFNELKQLLSKDELELFANEFDFLD